MSIIPGAVLSGTTPIVAPIILVIAREKAGKSCLPITLKDWPTPGATPFVVAFDETGPDSAARLGSPLWHLKISGEIGNTTAVKMQSAIRKLETAFKGGARPHNAIVVDCCSTMCDRLFDDAQRFSKNSDPRSHYGDVLNASRSFFYRLLDLGVPTIWIAWLREPETVKDKGGGDRFIAGGPQVLGKFRETLSGKAHAILLLEKRHGAPGDPNMSSDGQVRQFRTRPFAGINCESRFALPDPMPANLGWVLHYITQGYQPEAAQAQQQVRQ